uniref:Lactamase_B domain-containing protein n=1 Tax=Heterorhabditis bacteriophora TaxID=37862 RepID=A0A1I7WJ48_HETBA
MMINLKAIFVTHAHQDHMNGLYTIIEKRKEAFDIHVQVIVSILMLYLGHPYVPLVLICNRNVLKPLRTYSMCFVNLESLVEIVDISRHPVTPPLRYIYYSKDIILHSICIRWLQKF